MDLSQQRINIFVRGNVDEWTLRKINLPAVSDMYGGWDKQIRSARTILFSLLKTHDTNLNYESLRTFLIDVKIVVNSPPLTSSLLSDVNSTILLSPINLLSLRSRVLMQPL